MNNKGQTLVIFILLLPVLLLLFAITVDLGLLLIKTNNVKNNIVEAIDYGLSVNDDNKDIKMYDLLKNKIGNNDTIYITSEDTITITVKGEYKSIFNGLLKNSFKYKYTYQGYLEGENKIIKKEG